MATLSRKSSDIYPVFDSSLDKKDGGDKSKGGSSSTRVKGEDLSTEKKDGKNQDKGQGEDQNSDQNGDQNGNQSGDQSGDQSGGKGEKSRPSGKVEKITDRRSSGESMASDEAKASAIQDKLTEMAKKSGLLPNGIEDKIDKKVKDIVDAGNRVAKERGLKDGMGGFGTASMQEYIKGITEIKMFPIILDLIKKRLNKFKALFTDLDSEDSSIPMRRYNPVANAIQGEISVDMPSTKKDDFNIPLLFMSVDTSGSMQEEELNLAISLINRAAQHFKISGSYPGKVVKIFFDDAVHLPIQLWQPLSKSEMEMKEIPITGRGGTGFRSLMASLDEIFVAKVKGQDCFVYNEKALAFQVKSTIGISGDIDHGSINWQIKGKKTADGKIMASNGQTFDPETASLKFNGKLSNVIYAPIKRLKKRVPFMICITDGGSGDMGDISASSLYKNNPDNMLFVLVGKQAFDSSLKANGVKSSNIVRLTLDNAEKVDEANNQNISSFFQKVFNEIKD